MECLDTSCQGSAKWKRIGRWHVSRDAGSEAFCDSAASQAGKAVGTCNAEPPGEPLQVTREAFMNGALFPSKAMTGSARGAVKNWSPVICAWKAYIPGDENLASVLKKLGGVNALFQVINPNRKFYRQ
ncbi:MAG: hypothetical protein ACTHMI_15070 [Mucilaginibacter sp.]